MLAMRAGKRAVVIPDLLLAWGAVRTKREINPPGGLDKFAPGFERKNHTRRAYFAFKT